VSPRVHEVYSDHTFAGSAEAVGEVFKRLPSTMQTVVLVALIDQTSG
jgi:hypothetical protein